MYGQLYRGKGPTRSERPKPEGRKKPEARNPKKGRERDSRAAFVMEKTCFCFWFGFRPSDFGFLSGFGLNFPLAFGRYTTKLRRARC
jgi:hypothetical protein